MAPTSPLPRPAAAAGGRPRLRGARTLTFSGVAVLVLAVVAGVLAGVLALRTLPTDVLDLSGGDGDGVLLSVPVPGTGSAELTGGEHAVYLARPVGTAEPGGATDAITVTGPDGETVPLRPAGVSSRTTMGGTTASTVTGFTVEVPGTYEITAAGDELPTGSRLLVVEDPGFASFFGGLAGTIAGVFAAIGLGLVGLALTISGGVLWYLRSRAAPADGASAPGPRT